VDASFFIVSLFRQSIRNLGVLQNILERTGKAESNKKRRWTISPWNY